MINDGEYLLVGGFNDEKYESQREGWHLIYEMENKIHVWNHQPEKIGIQTRKCELQYGSMDCFLRTTEEHDFWWSESRDMEGSSFNLPFNPFWDVRGMGCVDPQHQRLWNIVGSATWLYIIRHNLD